LCACNCGTAVSRSKDLTCACGIDYSDHLNSFFVIREHCLRRLHPSHPQGSNWHCPVCAVKLQLPPSFTPTPFIKAHTKQPTPPVPPTPTPTKGTKSPKKASEPPATPAKVSVPPPDPSDAAEEGRKLRPLAHSYAALYELLKIYYDHNCSLDTYAEQALNDLQKKNFFTHIDNNPSGQNTIKNLVKTLRSSSSPLLKPFRTNQDPTTEKIMHEKCLELLENQKM
jgi:hypothetical protein